MNIKVLGMLLWIWLPQTVWADVNSAHSDPINAIILMPAVTTFMTPMWMRFQYKRSKKRVNS